MAFFSSSWQILTVALIAGPSGVRASVPALPQQPLAVTPPCSPEALSAWGEEVAAAADDLQQRCGQVANELRNFRKDGTAATFGPDDPASLLFAPADTNRTTAAELAKLSDVLGGLRDLASPARRVLPAIRVAAGLVKDVTCTNQTATQKGLAVLPGVRDRFLVCLLGVVGKARGVMGAEDEKVDWAPLEGLAIEEAETDPISADLKFSLGLYWSEVAMASSESAGSSDAWWVGDSGGASAPSPIVRAETLLQDSQLATETPLARRSRAAIRALRLYQHADLMARKQHTAAAVWRYRTAAKLASGCRRSRVPVHGLEMRALTRLAYFLERSGKDTEALDAATEALKLQHTSATSCISLPKFLQATLRRRLGELKSDSDVRDAEMQLLAVKGRLPSHTLESERAVAHAEFVAWRNVAEAPAWSSERYKRCFGMTDAARTLICMLCSAVFS